ncbi:phosphohydrolase [Arcobacter sp. CECT 8983]|uniref:HD-GYP domain-containing protein n=1 Tax=Arcobacter sp. CECT 8983 TaxID=2044508 RepID=UPI00100C16E1|nr:HD domain-containing phosphohydrolase [Arcobacter sp. CECT 8983]RXJ89212.1 phosphohydrolase [Arcobacter sp. CECT 8983]
MDKKRQMNFNLNNFLLLLSNALDEVEARYFNTSKNHSKRVAYLSLKFALEFNYKQDALFDICAYSLMHNIALSQEQEDKEKFCNLANEYAMRLPFDFKEQEDVLKYQYESFDGSGPFNLKEYDIPLFSQFIYFANNIDTKFDLSKTLIENRTKILAYIKENENILFSSDLVECFEEFAQNQSFWLDLQNENELLTFIFSTLHDKTIVLDFEELLEISSIFTLLTNEDLNIIENASKVAQFYNFEHKDKQTFMIAASLCNIGKLYIDENILNKENTLTKNEYEKVKAYPYYTKKILSNIIGFNDICSYAFKVQEQIDSKGYPFNLEAKDLSLKDRCLSLTNIYTSLRSNKSYRKAYSKNEAFNILEEMAKEKRVDITIVNDFKEIFK